jgi:hypothetical protein
MELVKKLKDVLSSVLPIVVVVVICHLFVTPLPPGYFGNFLLGSLYVILGLTLFLLGVDISIVPVGQVIGSKVMEKRSALLLVVVGFVVGFVITYAEPNALVLASQVSLVNQAIQARKLLLMLSLGVGVYIALAFARLVLHIPLKYVLLVSYVVVFVLAFLNPETMVSIGFDSGGSATGPMAVPFIMALGIGAARVQSGSTEMDNFGFVGMQSIGAIIAVLVMGLLVPQGSSATVVPSYPSGHFLSMAGAQFQSVASSMLPLVAVVLFFQFTLLRMPRIQMTRVFVGMVYCFVGMSVFLLGANSGFMPVAFVLGEGDGIPLSGGVDRPGIGPWRAGGACRAFRLRPGHPGGGDQQQPHHQTDDADVPRRGRFPVGGAWTGEDGLWLLHPVGSCPGVSHLVHPVVHRTGIVRRHRV